MTVIRKAVVGLVAVMMLGFGMFTVDSVHEQAPASAQTSCNMSANFTSLYGYDGAYWTYWHVGSDAYMCRMRSKIRCIDHVYGLNYYRYGSWGQWAHKNNGTQYSPSMFCDHPDDTLQALYVSIQYVIN
jgi:hypothetical protein